jgi:PAS domain S-box-containing protein
MRDDAPISNETELYRLIFETSCDAIVVLDEDGTLLEANRSARELRGVDVARLLASPAEHGVNLDAFRAAMRTTGRAFTELRIATDERRPRRIAVHGKMLHRRDVLFLRDVTDRHDLDEELRHLRRIESIGYLTASVVHDFNNVLTPILCVSEALVRDSDERTSKRALEIRNAAERAAGLVRQVLTFARREPSKPERVNLGAVVNEIRTLVERVAGDDVEVTLTLDPSVADTVVDREQLEHVVLNLTANARDAMPRGGHVTIATATVPVEEADPCAEDRPSAPTSYVVLTVRDDGVGMSQEVRERVFERFFTTKEAGMGTGLGLATARRFALQSGGCMSVRSEQGRGTTVALYLPRAPAMVLDTDPPVSHEEPRGGSETVLLVEDDEQVRRTLRAVLEEFGYTVLDAATGERALELVAGHGGPIDLVLTDVVMPRMGGRALVHALMEAGLDAKTLYMSGHGDDAIGLHGVRPEDPIIRKAFSPTQLARKVREVLGPEERTPEAGAVKENGSER